MKCVNANSLFLQLDHTLSDVENIVARGADPSTQSYLARYLTVYITGLYEQSIEEIIWQYASLLGSPEMENFTSNQIDVSFRNPDMPNILRLVKQFSTPWSNTLKSMDNRHKDAINSIVSNKNLIAHGQPSLITFADIKCFHADAKVVIEKIDMIFLGV